MNLPPGHYHFQEVACNNDGVWNKVGDTLAFEITPAFYPDKASFSEVLWFRSHWPSGGAFFSYELDNSPRV